MDAGRDLDFRNNKIVYKQIICYHCIGGQRDMSVSERVTRFVIEHKPACLCDDCIQRELLLSAKATGRTCDQNSGVHKSIHPPARLLRTLCTSEGKACDQCGLTRRGKEEMASATSATSVKVADEAWIITALMHREQPRRPDFAIDEILRRAKDENVAGKLRPGFYAHVVQHCVANRAPNSGRYRMLFETAPGRRRLFRSGDSYDPAREGAKTVPRKEEIPPEYADLLDWYRDWDHSSTEDRIKIDPLLALYGSGKDLWADQHADEYIRRLREGWE